MKTASEYAKEAGLPSLKTVAEISGESTQTLNNWLNNKPFIFHAVIEKTAKEYKMKTIEEAVATQTKAVELALKNNDSLSIAITDNVCALDFRAYAIKENWEDNEFEIAFEDAENVPVSKEDFIKYNFQYTDLALEIEDNFSECLDELRDAQQDAQDELLLEV